jgi:hypothetical protein
MRPVEGGVRYVGRSTRPYHLLEDDGLITNIDTKTAHRSEPAAQDPDEVVLLLRARTGATDVVVGNSA